MPMDTYTIEQAEEDIATLRGQIQLLTEIIQMSNGPTPNTPASGTVALFASGGQPNYLNSAGLQMGLVGAQNATYPGTAVTAASLTNLGTFTIPANDAEVGAIYELEAEGNGTQAGTTATTLQLGVALGGTAASNQIMGSGFCPAGGTFRWSAAVRAICVTTGVSGTWRTKILATVCQNATPNNAVTITDTQIATPITGNTTSSLTLALQAAWGTTTGSPTLTNQCQVPKRIA